MSVSTRGTENNKQLMKLSRGKLSFELCQGDQRKKYQMCGKYIKRKDGEKETEWVDNLDGKILLGRPKYILLDNIKINLREGVRGCGINSSVSGRKPMLCCCEHKTGNQTSVLQEFDTGLQAPVESVINDILKMIIM